MPLPANNTEARAYLDHCHAWLMALDQWDRRQELLFEERGLQWIEMDAELRARELTAGLVREAEENAVCRGHGDDGA